MRKLTVQLPASAHVQALAVLVLAVLMLLPIMVVLSYLGKPFDDNWAHLSAHVLPRVLKNTALLLALVGFGSGVLGVSLAWLTSVYQFFGVRVLTWALMLPLAIPAYVLAFVSLGLFDYGAWLPTLFREQLSIQLPSLRSVWGAGAVLSLVFYPYVYLLARSAFVSQGVKSLEAGALLGLSDRASFFRIILPQSAPWIVGGLLLVGMEVLADFGAVSVFNVDTFTTAIYQSWFALFSLTTAAQLAALLILTVFVFVLAEQHWQSKRSTLGAPAKPIKKPLTGLAGWLAFGFCGLVLVLSFVLPVVQLIAWTVQSWQPKQMPRFLGMMLNTLKIATITALVLMVLGLLLAWFKRLRLGAAAHGKRGAWLVKALVSMSVLGYAVPGTVLAVGVFIPVAWLDNWLIKAGVTHTQVLSGSAVLMITALCVRFLSVVFAPIDRQFTRLSRSQQDMATLLTPSAWQRWRQVYLPSVSAGLLAGVLFGFVEVAKEMPITLMTRRGNLDTLAVQIFQFTSEGMWAQAALPSLCIILLSFLPVWFLIRQQSQN